MSRAPDHNSNGKPIDSASEKRPPEGDSDSALNSDIVDSAEGNEVLLDDPEEEDDDEFSLSQLSQAYAKLKRTESDQSTETKLSDEVKVATQSVLVMSPRSGDPVTTSTANEKEARDNAGCPISPASIVEAIVFVGLPGDEKLTVKKVSSLLRDVSPKEIKSIVQQLNERFQNEQAAFRIVLNGDSICMQLDDSMLSFQRELSRQNKGVKLNAATIEVLAVIAYNQPITREKIDETRKKSSGAIVAQLVRRGLIAPVEGEPSVQQQRLMTTERFLKLFQLSELGDLPQGSDVSDLDELLS